MDEVQQIKERLDIVEVVSSYLTLKKAGVNMKANCPFHHEKSPSFMVSPERQTFHCFGCNEGGDIFTFIEKIEGVDFFNALKILADKAGVLLKTQSIQYKNKEFKSDKKTRLFEINDWTKKLYHKLLLEHPKAEKARQYVYRKRKMTEAIVKEFEIGYAPASWDLLIKFLKNKGYGIEEIFQAGVVVRNEKGDYYDRFRGRIIFPINNIMGATIAFTSRILEPDEKQAKYINSSESPVYIKGKTIYGLDKAKLAIKEQNLAVFVEGNMDVIACHQAGFRNVVATSGTAITEDQLRVLNRYTDDIAFSFDSDLAGQTAMKKAVRLALKNDINSRIIALSGPYKDPDEAISADPKNWERAVQNSKPSLEYWIDSLVKAEPTLEISTKKNISREILPVIKTIFSPIEKEYYLKYLSTKLSISEKSLIAALDKTKDEQQPVSDKIKEEPDLKQKLSTEEKLFGLLWSQPAQIDQHKDGFKNFNFSIKKDLPLFSEMLKAGNFDQKQSLPIEEVNKLNQFAMIAMKDFNLSDEEAIKNELNFLLGRLKSDQKDSLKDEFARKIQSAEAAGDKKKVRELLNQFSTLIK